MRTWAAESPLFNHPHFPPSDSSVKFFVKIMRSRFVLIMFIATACCMELTKLEEESRDVIALDDLVPSAPSKKRKSTYIDQDQSALKRHSFAHCGAETSFRQVAHEQVEYPSRKEFTNLIKDSPLEDLHPKKFLRLSRSWDRNSDQVLSLATDFEEILNQQKWKELLLDRLSGSSEELCVKIRDSLNLLKEKRLLQLGGLKSGFRDLILLELNHNEASQMAKQIQGFPPDMVNEIVKKTWEKFSWVIVDDIKQIIIDQKSLSKHQENSGENASVPAVK
ncbi:hypothetical protein H4Q26_005525 [Puccinia striiformis f. sp. tritici PST-130]|nr:hypothetical protein H4Q26_005525 [Puccinia striiformis f. sp. tritici PST-130]